jgi:hypothetical protein
MIKMWGISMENKYSIIHIHDHYEIYINGRFYCSADTMEEAVREIEGGILYE